MTIGSHISIDIGPVPFTLQNAAVFLLAMTVPPGRAFLAVLTWIAWGVIGMPLFALFYSGAESIAGPTGGYFLGMLVAAPLMSLCQFRWAYFWNRLFSFKREHKQNLDAGIATHADADVRSETVGFSVDSATDLDKSHSDALYFFPAVMVGILGSGLILFLGWGYLALYYFAWDAALEIGVTRFILPSIGKIIATAGVVRMFKWSKIGA